MASSMGNKVRFIARAFIWEHRAHQAKTVYRRVRRAREGVREIKDGARDLFRLLVGR